MKYFVFIISSFLLSVAYGDFTFGPQVLINTEFRDHSLSLDEQMAQLNQRSLREAGYHCALLQPHIKTVAQIIDEEEIKIVGGFREIDDRYEFAPKIALQTTFSCDSNFL